MNSWIITNTIGAWLIPPGFLLLLAAWGLLRMRRSPKSGRTIVGLALLALWALSMPWVSRQLLGIVAPEPADPLRAPSAQVIVVLGGGQYHNAPEFGTDTVSESTLVRVRYAAHLQRLTGKPVLVSGGSPEGSAVSEAQAMKAVLEKEFQVPVMWMEQTSNNTLENARESFGILSAQGIRRIYLVTHAWHMRRAQRVFEQVGFAVVPAPTGYRTAYRTTLLDFMPTAYALRDSSLFCREAVGIVWYRLKSFIP